ncbi:hypothetical protein [Falsirhodobacter algicola]|uniref:Uncharacterized protein n=1 Tax=Falsirhodobacter algicola TaxID=2692330 RepID=A0A8J8MT68_9RHOB|nr:hypothetical protein [Falsirhodobacter algicola]QUS36022.1 hypothetical protein GR316_06925 [Falsirhodobacter algicola]
MLRTILSSAALAALVALPIQAQERFDEINVGVDLNQVTSPEAAARYANISDDLVKAIGDALSVTPAGTADGGAKIVVDLDEVALAAPFVGTPGASTSAMAGTVAVEDQGDIGSQRKFDLTVTMDQIMPYMPENTDMTVIEPSSDAVYQALLQTFAAAVVSNLEG